MTTLDPRQPSVKQQGDTLADQLLKETPDVIKPLKDEHVKLLIIRAYMEGYTKGLQYLDKKTN